MSVREQLKRYSSARKSVATIKAKARMIAAWEKMNGRPMSDAEKKARGF